ASCNALALGVIECTKKTDDPQICLSRWAKGVGVRRDVAAMPSGSEASTRGRKRTAPAHTSKTETPRPGSAPQAETTSAPKQEETVAVHASKPAAPAVRRTL